MKIFFSLLLITASFCAQASDYTIYFHSSYNLTKKYPYAKDSIQILIKRYIKQSIGTSYSVDINWLNYSDAIDFSNEDNPSIALLTTGMYCHINQINPKSTEEIKIIGIVNRFGTTYYKYMVLLKKGYELNPNKLKGKLAIKKKRSLSGSLFSLNYLIQNHGFPKGLLFDDHVRSEWAMYDKYHSKLDTLRAKYTEAVLYCGEGLDRDRDKIEKNGWQIFPKLDEEAYNVEISRSLLMTKNLSPHFENIVRDLFDPKTEVGSKILRLINVERIENISFRQVEKVIDEYNRIISPKTEFQILVSRIHYQLGLYILSLVLLVISHLVFRYKIAKARDSFLWIAMIIIIKIAIFICEVWYFNPEVVCFIISALAIGSLEKETLKKIIQKRSNIELPPN